jgi:hypothetical protein
MVAKGGGKVKVKRTEEGTSTMARRDSIVEHDIRVGSYEDSVVEGISRSVFN